MRWSVIAFALGTQVGCATATEQDVLNTKDSGGADSSTKVDTGVVEDTAMPTCGENVTCKIGETRTSDCGFCGKVTDTCDPETCTWKPGKCMAEGPCEPGTSDEADCTTGGEKKRRTCSAMCTWGEYGACGVLNPWKATATPPTGFEGRYFHSAVWTGSEMIVFGGLGATGAKKDGAAFDPAKNTWRTIAAPPASFAKGRKQHQAVWTGSKMIVWGGLDTDNYYATTNAAYDPKTDTWSDVKAAAINARTFPAAVWTGSEMLIWGSGYNDGASYDPATDSWTAIPASPLTTRSGQNAVWNGSRLIVWSGCPGGVICANDGASYDPKDKTWTKLPDPPMDMDGRFDAVAVANGPAAFFWGGYGGVDPTNTIKKTGAIYEGASGWKSIAKAEGALAGGRQLATAWSTGGKVFVFSGKDDTPSALNGGAIYDVASDKWSPMATMDAPEARIYSTVVWTGAEAIVWGGTRQLGVPSAILRDGAAYRP